MADQTEQEPKAPCAHCGRTDWRWTGECGFDDPAAGPPSYRRVEMRCDWCRPLRMDAYYFGFSATGVELVDRVLSAVAMAGKGYHHTESWGDEGQEDWGPFRGGDYVSWIQNAASDVAALLRERDAQIARLTEQVERQTTALRSIAQWCPPSAPGAEWQGSGNYDDAYNAGSDDAYWALGQIALAALTAPQEV